MADKAKNFCAKHLRGPVAPLLVFTAGLGAGAGLFYMKSRQSEQIQETPISENQKSKMKIIENQSKEPPTSLKDDPFQ